VEMDIGHLRHLRWAKSNQQNEWVAYNRIRGQYASALEHATPERFFVDTTTCNLPTSTPTSTPPYDAAKPACAEGISAVKALAVAQSQGQKVFTVTSQNVAAVLPQLTGQSQQTRADVQNAVNAGKEVTISQSKITYAGWSGAGYLVIDPQTGAGSYLIEGGANGGSLTTNSAAQTLIGLALGLVSGLAAVIAGPVVAAIVGTIGVIISVINFFFLSPVDNLNFSGARLLSTLAGVALSVILGGYVFVTFPILFVPGLLLLALLTLITLARVLYVSLAILETDKAQRRWFV
jgi:hypothetical protein